jgi:restriction system protein
MSFKSTWRGWKGEIWTILVKKLFLSSADYVDLNNVTLEAANGTTQIDHVIVSRFGIFVVETKNLSGSIFGDMVGKTWTQTLPGKRLVSHV